MALIPKLEKQQRIDKLMEQTTQPGFSNSKPLNPDYKAPTTNIDKEARITALMDKNMGAVSPIVPKVEQQTKNTQTSNSDIELGKLLVDRDRNFDKYHSVTDDNYKQTLSKEDAIKYQKEGAELSRAGAFGSKHPVLGTVLSLASTPFVAVEGVMDNILGLVTGDESFSNKTGSLAEKREQLREGVKANMYNGQGAYDMATGIGDMLVNTATAAATGGGTVAAGALMGGNRANVVQKEASERGLDTRKASALGTIAGGAEGYFNTLGLDKLKEGAGILKGAGIEGLENIAQSGVEDIADTVISGKNSEINNIKQSYINQGMSEEEANRRTIGDVAKQYGMEFGTGAAFGALMGAGRNVSDKLRSHIVNQDGNGRSMSDIIESLADEDVSDDIADNVVDNADNAIRDNIEEVIDNIDNIRNDTNVDVLDNGVQDTEGRIDNILNNLENQKTKPTENINDIPRLRQNEGMDLADENYDPKNDPFQELFDGFLEDDVKVSNAEIPNIKPTENITENTEIPNNEAQAKIQQGFSEGYANKKANIPQTFQNKIDSDANDFRKIANAVKFDNPQDKAAAKEGIKKLYEKTKEFKYCQNMQDITAWEKEVAPIFNETMDILKRGKLEYADNSAKIANKQLKDDFYRMTQGTVIQIPANLRSEFTDMKMKDFNDLSFRLFGKDSKKLRFVTKAQGEAPDTFMNEYRDFFEALGIYDDNPAIALGNLKDYMQNLATQGKGKAPIITENVTDDLFDDYWASMSDNSVLVFPIYDVEGDINSRNFNEALDVIKNKKPNLYEQAQAEINNPINPSGVETSINRLNSPNTDIEANAGKNIPLNNESVLNDTNRPITDNAVNNAEPNRNIAQNADDGSATFTFDMPKAENTDIPQAENATRDINQRPFVNENTNSPDMAERRTVTNTAKNNSLLDNLKEDEIKQLKEYERIHESTSLSDAEERVKDTNSRLRWESDFVNGNRKFQSSTDTDTGMLLLTDIEKQIRNTDEADVEAINNLTARKQKLLSNMAEQMTEKGQAIQALAKWNRTSDGAILNGEILAEKEVKKWANKGKNTKDVDFNKKIAGALSMLNPKNAAKETAEQAENTIEGIKNALDKGGVLNNFNEDAINQLKDLLDEGMTKRQLADEIDHYMKHGEFFPWTEEEQIIAKTSRKLDKVFENWGDQDAGKIQRMPKTIEEITEEVKGSLDKEFASISQQFSDDDARFIAELIQGKKANWIIEDEIRHFLKHGEFYEWQEDIEPKLKKSNRLAKILENWGNNFEDEKIPKVKKSKEQIIDELSERVKNTLSDESASIEEQFTDADYRFLAELINDRKIEDWVIEDELNHKFTHGEFYPYYEDEVVKKKTAKWMDKILENMGNDTPAEPKVKTPKTVDEIAEEIKNSFEDESSSINGLFSDEDYKALATLKSLGVSNDEIENEVINKLRTGDFYTISEATPTKLPSNQKLNNALKELYGTRKPKVEAEPKTFNQIREEVKNTILKNRVNGEITDNDIDYLAGMIQNGATTKELTDLLNRKAVIGNFGISNQTQKEVAEIFDSISHLDPNSKDYVEMATEAYRKIAFESLPNATFGEKFDAWRYLAMLGNPKTITRNVLGNKMNAVTTGFSNNLAAAMEIGADKLSKNGIERTKAFINPIADKPLLDLAKQDADNFRYADLSGSRFSKRSVQDDIIRNRQIWEKGGIVDKWQNATDRFLTDYPAAKNKYSTSLVGYMKANKLDEDAFMKEALYKNLKAESKIRVLSTDERVQMNEYKAVADLMEKARDYATKEAKYATFHEDSVIADKISRTISDWKNTDAEGTQGTLVRTAGRIAEGNIPFVSTPINITKVGIQYSPLNAISSISKTGKMILKKGVEPADVISSWSKTLTGSAMFLMGKYLYDRGVLLSSDNETAWQDTLEGKQNYSIKFTKPNGGEATYTVDWLAPGIMPMILGTEYAKMMTDKGEDDTTFIESIKNKDFENAIETAANSALNIASPIMENSMLNGLNDTLKTAANAAQNKEQAGAMLGEAALNSLVSYGTQGVPTIAGQFARTIDNTRRSTYTEKQGIVGVLDKQLQKQENKLPFLSMFNNPYVDTYGRQQNNGIVNTDNPLVNFLPNLAYQMFSPGYFQNVKQTDVDKEAWRLYEGNNDPSVFPNTGTQAKIGGKKMDKDASYLYNTTAGTALSEMGEALVNSEYFKGLSDEDKAEALTDMYQTARATGNVKVGADTKPSENQSKLVNVYNTRGGQGYVNKVKADAKEKEQKEIKKAENKKYESYGVTKTEKTEAVMADKGEAGLKFIGDMKKAIKDEHGKIGAVKAYEYLSSQNLSDYDKGYYIVQTASSLPKLVKQMAAKKDYASVNEYYYLKDTFDTDGNGKLKKSEKDAMIPSLKKMGYSDSDMQRVAGYFD